MNRQIYNTHMHLFNNCGCGHKKCSKLSIIIFVALLLFVFMVHTIPAKKGYACNAAFNMLHARLCTCHTDYIDMNKPE